MGNENGIIYVGLKVGGIFMETTEEEQMAHLHAKGDNLGGVLRNGGLSCLIRSIEILDPKALML